MTHGHPSIQPPTGSTSSNAAGPDETFSTAGKTTSITAAIRILDHWGISEIQAASLLSMSSETWRARRASDSGPSDHAAATRASHILGIHGALATLLSDDRRAGDWVKTPNAAFGGRTALDIMLTGEAGLVRVRRYLVAECFC